MEPHNFRDVMKNLFIGGKYSDLVISCGGHDFRVHRNIVCSQSDFFEAAANGYFSVHFIRGSTNLSHKADSEY